MLTEKPKLKMKQSKNTGMVLSKVSCRIRKTEDKLIEKTVQDNCKNTVPALKFTPGCSSVNDNLHERINEDQEHPTDTAYLESHSGDLNDNEAAAAESDRQSHSARLMPTGVTPIYVKASTRNCYILLFRHRCDLDSKRKEAKRNKSPLTPSKNKPLSTKLHYVECYVCPCHNLMDALLHFLCNSIIN
jgi:hypothetical protein